MRNELLQDISLLLVDDSLDDIDFVKSLLEKFEKKHLYPHISVAFCNTLDEAEKALATNNFNFILLDLYLDPEIKNIFQGLKLLVEKFPEIPIVVYSAVYSPEVVEEAIAVGAQDYIVKGLMKGEELARTIYHAKLRHNASWKIHSLILAQ